MRDVIIIGSGPAGVSAAIGFKRSGINPLVITTHKSTLLKARDVENYYGIEFITGPELYDLGIRQLDKFGIETLNLEVTDVSKDENFTINTSDGIFESKFVIIATGVSILKVNFNNLVQYEGNGISYCALCDGYFFKGKKVGLVGSGEYALSEYNNLKNIINDIVVFTNGEDSEVFDRESIVYRKEKIAGVYGEELLGGITFEDGSTLDLDGLFIASGIAGGMAFAKKLGIVVDKNFIVVDNNFKTNVDGIYAIGDIIGGFLQVSTAASEGMLVTKDIINSLKNSK